MTIPPDINQWSRLQEVQFYLECGLLIQPVYGPGANIALADRGKKPRLSLAERLAQSREDVLTRFSNGTDDNVGQIPKRPHVAIDLDDKSPDGRALACFFVLYPDFEKVPRVRT